LIAQNQENKQATIENAAQKRACEPKFNSFIFIPHVLLCHAGFPYWDNHPDIVAGIWNCWIPDFLYPCICCLCNSS
jgi:hypothetical protein